MAKIIPGLLACIAAGTLLGACQPRPSTIASAAAPSPQSPTETPSSGQPQAAASAVPAPAPLPHEGLSDAMITARTKAGILSDPDMAGADVSVNTDRGVVELTGTIKSREQAAIASSHAQEQDGVMRVDNHLSVNLQ